MFGDLTLSPPHHHNLSFYPVHVCTCGDELENLISHTVCLGPHDPLVLCISESDSEDSSSSSKIFSLELFIQPDHSERGRQATCRFLRGAECQILARINSQTMGYKIEGIIFHDGY